MSKTIIYTIKLAVDAEDAITQDCYQMDQLREYGAAEIVDVDIIPIKLSDFKSEDLLPIKNDYIKKVIKDTMKSENVETQINNMENRIMKSIYNKLLSDINKSINAKR